MVLKKFCTRILALGLAGAALLSSGAAAVFDSSFKYAYTIGSQATYTRYEGRTESGLQRASYIEYTPSTSISPKVVYAGDAIYGSKSTITEAQKYLQNQGYQVIGGINADFFVTGTSIPIGMVIKDGTLISSDAWQYAVGFMADGSAIIGKPSTTMKVEGPSGAVWASYFNKSRTASGIYLLDSDFSDSTHISTAGKSIVFERVDDTPITVGGSIRMRAIAKGAGNGATTITKNQVVLSIDDKCQATWVDFPIGEEVTLTIDAPDVRWSNVVYAVGGKSLVTNGTVSTAGIDGGSSNAPRTAVGVKDDGTVLLYEIDGRQSSVSVGLTAAQLGNELVSMGYNNVLCLDGGGSSALTVRIPGETETKLVTSPSDGAQRKCANYIFLVNQASPNGVAQHVHFRPSYYYIMPGASTYFSTWASDSAYAPATLPADMTYSASSGTVDSAAQIYYADPAAASGPITISGTSVDGSVTGSHQFCVTTAIDSIVLTTGGNAIASTSLRGGETLDLDATAYHLNTKMASADSSFQWSVSGNIGTIDSAGVFTAYEQPASGIITCSYGNVSASVNVTVGLSDPPALTNIADFETTQPLTSNDAVLARTTNLNQVGSGRGALSASYSKQGEIAITIPDAATAGMSHLTLLAQDSNAGSTLSAVFTAQDGSEILVPMGTVSQNAYTRLTAQVPANAAALTGLRLTDSASGTLYLDHIMLTAKLLSNTDAPAISWISSTTKVSAGGSTTVRARINMANGYYVMRPEQVTAYVDGTKSSAVYSAASGTIDIPTYSLQEGTHQVTVEAFDDVGNFARKTLTITAGSASATTFADTTGNWANGYINFAANNGLLQGQKTSSGTTAFYPSRNLTRGEFAVIMARYYGLDTSNTDVSNFADAKEIPTWSAGAIHACSTQGIMSGRLNTKTNRTGFNASANITRQEVLTVVSKLLPRGIVASTKSFTDSKYVAAWASTAIQNCVAADIIDGYSDNTIRPVNSITRAEIAKVLCTLY